MRPKKMVIGFFPTPLYRLTKLSRETGVQIYIKRDDLSGMGGGGNKIRKLEFLMREAIEQDCTTVLTFGGPQTNHGRQTAAVACRLGMKCIIIATMKESGPNRVLSGNLLLDAILGAEVVFMDTSHIEKTADPEEYLARVGAFRSAVSAQLIREREQAGEKVYLMPAGGSSETGCMAYAEGFDEIAEQARALDFAPDYIVCGAGSLGTYAGLVIGSKRAKSDTEILGVCVRPRGEAYRAKAADLINRTAEQYGEDVRVGEDELRLILTAYAGKGYDEPDDDTYAAILKLARTEGLFADPCYTGKSFAGLLGEIKSGRIPQGARVVYLHTGGVPGLFSEQHVKRFSEMLWEGKEHRVIGAADISEG